MVLLQRFKEMNIPVSIAGEDGRTCLTDQIIGAFANLFCFYRTPCTKFKIVYETLHQCRTLQQVEDDFQLARYSLDREAVFTTLKNFTSSHISLCTAILICHADTKPTSWTCGIWIQRSFGDSHAGYLNIRIIITLNINYN